MDLETLAERVAGLQGRVVQLELVDKELAADFKLYRHDVRNDLHKIELDLDRMSYDSEERGKELDSLRNVV
jgi:hypothetical protein